MTDHAQIPPSEAQHLPGLAPAAQSARVSGLEAAVRRTFAAIDAGDALSEVDAGKMEIALSLARVMAGKERGGRVSTYSNDARLLMEILDSYTADDDLTGVDERMAQLMEKWSDNADRDLTA